MIMRVVAGAATVTILGPPAVRGAVARNPARSGSGRGPVPRTRGTSQRVAGLTGAASAVRFGAVFFRAVARFLLALRVFAMDFLSSYVPGIEGY
jgi:hypothetical protein